jgi:hypothetical protein
MERYFFHLHECGTVTPDEEGRELEGLDAARGVGVEAAREIMAADLCAGEICLSCHIDVTDRSGAVVLTIPFRDTVTISGL